MNNSKQELLEASYKLQRLISNPYIVKRYEDRKKETREEIDRAWDMYASRINKGGRK